MLIDDGDMNRYLAAAHRLRNRELRRLSRALFTLPARLLAAYKQRSHLGKGIAHAA